MRLYPKLQTPFAFIITACQICPVILRVVYTIHHLAWAREDAEVARQRTWDDEAEASWTAPATCHAPVTASQIAFSLMLSVARWYRCYRFQCQLLISIHTVGIGAEHTHCHLFLRCRLIPLDLASCGGVMVSLWGLLDSHCCGYFASVVWTGCYRW
jgi:hypothetical protein